MRAFALLLILLIAGGGGYLYHHQQQNVLKLQTQIQSQWDYQKAQEIHSQKQSAFVNDLFRQAQTASQKHQAETAELRKTLEQIGDTLRQQAARQVTDNPPTPEEKEKVQSETKEKAEALREEIQQSNDQFKSKTDKHQQHLDQLKTKLGENHPTVRKGIESAERFKRIADEHGSLTEEIFSNQTNPEGLAKSHEKIQTKIQESKDREQQLKQRRAALRAERNEILSQSELSDQNRTRLSEIELELDFIEQELQAESDNQFALNLLKTLANLFLAAQCLSGNVVACFTLLFSLGGGDGDGDGEGEGDFEGMYPPGPPPGPKGVSGNDPAPVPNPNPNGDIRGRSSGDYSIELKPLPSGQTEILIRHAPSGQSESYGYLDNPQDVARLNNATAEISGFGGNGPKAIYLFDPNGTQWSIESQGPGNPMRVNE